MRSPRRNGPLLRSPIYIIHNDTRCVPQENEWPAKARPKKRLTYCVTRERTACYARSPRENGLQYAKHENGLLYAKLERRNGLLYAKLVNGLLHARLVEGAADGLQPSPTTNSVTQGEQPATSEAEDERPMAYWPKIREAQETACYMRSPRGNGPLLRSPIYCPTTLQPLWPKYQGRDNCRSTWPTHADGKRWEKETGTVKARAAHR